MKELTFVLMLAASPFYAFAQQTDSAATVTEPAKVQAGVPVTGTITDANTKQPLAGISVFIPGFSAALTDDNGKFTLNAILI